MTQCTGAIHLQIHSAFFEGIGGADLSIACVTMRRTGLSKLLKAQRQAIRTLIGLEAHGRFRQLEVQSLLDELLSSSPPSFQTGDAESTPSTLDIFLC